MNATSHGFFSRDVLLPGESEWEFHDLRERLIDALRPQDFMELHFVETIVQANWKIRRIQESELHVHQSKESEIVSKTKAYADRIREESRGRLRPDVTDNLVTAAQAKMDASISMACMLITTDKSFERLTALQIRLHNLISRTMRDLSRYRKEKQEREELAPSPFSKQQLNSIEERWEEKARKFQSRTGYRPPPPPDMNWEESDSSCNDAPKCPDPARNGAVCPAPQAKMRNEPKPTAQRPTAEGRDRDV